MRIVLLVSFQFVWDVGFVFKVKVEVVVCVIGGKLVELSIEFFIHPSEFPDYISV